MRLENTHFARIGSNEEFVPQLVLEMPELVDATLIHGAARDKLKEAISSISIEGLMPAFERLMQIRTSATEPLPELNRKQLYEDFSRTLWHAYKDLMQRAARLMDTDMGFLFQKDSQFDAGVAALITRWLRLRETNVGDYLRQTRSIWQNDLADFRNNDLEHKDDRDPAVYAVRYTPPHAESLFNHVWRTIADILSMLVSVHLITGVSLVEIPGEHSSKARRRRFGFSVPGLKSAQMWAIIYLTY